MSNHCQEYSAVDKPTLVLMIGRIASGKSTTAEALRQRFDGSVVSFGRAISQIARERGIPINRPELQKLGQDLVDNAPDFLISRTLDVIGVDDLTNRVRIVDGLRHLTIMEDIKRMFVNWSTVTVYIDLPVSECIKRAEARGIDKAEYLRYETHETELDVHDKLKAASDVVIDGFRTTDDIVEIIARSIRTIV